MLQAAKLWERISAKGNKYLSGRLGGVKVLIMENKDFNADDPNNSHTHNLLFADGAAQPAQTRPTAPAEPRQRTSQKSPRQQIEDNPIPF